MTYGSMDADGKTPTFGGYSTQIVVDEHFVLSLPEELDPAASAPLLCAGITTYSPLRQVGLTKGSQVAVMGLGGLGHMGVKLACSFGAEVTVLSRSPQKETDAKRLGAREFVPVIEPRAAAPLLQLPQFAGQGAFQTLNREVFSAQEHANRAVAASD